MKLQRGNEEIDVADGVPWAHLKALGWEPADSAGMSQAADDVDEADEISDADDVDEAGAVPVAKSRHTNRK